MGSLWNGFVWDDWFVVVENQYLFKMQYLTAHFTNPRTISSIDGFRCYRPIRNVSFMIDALFWGKDATGFHLTNVVLHGTICLMLFFLLLHLRFGLWPSFAAAGLFAIHPALSETVFWIKGRADLLCTFWMLAAFILFRLQRPKHAVARGLLVAVCAMLAMGAKELAVVFPFLLLGHDVLEHKKVRRDTLLLVLFVGLLMVLFFHGRARMIASLPGKVGEKDLLPRMTANLQGLGEYGRLLLVPWHLHIDYAGLIDEQDGWMIAMGVVLALLFAVLWVVLVVRNQRCASFGLFWFAFSLMPTIGKNFLASTTASQLIAERFLYLPAVGLVLAVACGLRHLTVRKWRWVHWALAGVIALLTVRTAVRASVWKSNFSLYSSHVDSTPFSKRILHNLAVLLHNQKRYDQNIMLEKNYGNRALAKTEAVFGFSYAMEGQVEKGEALMKEALRSQPHDTICLMYYGFYLGQQGEHDGLIRHFRKALETETYRNHRRVLYFNIANAYINKQQPLSAIEQLELLVEESPFYSDAYQLLGALCVQVEAWNKALAAYEKLETLEPEEAQWRQKKAEILKQMNHAGNPTD